MALWFMPLYWPGGRLGGWKPDDASLGMLGIWLVPYVLSLVLSIRVPKLSLRVLWKASLLIALSVPIGWLVYIGAFASGGLVELQAWLKEPVYSIVRNLLLVLAFVAPAGLAATCVLELLRPIVPVSLRGERMAILLCLISAVPLIAALRVDIPVAGLFHFALPLWWVAFSCALWFDAAGPALATWIRRIAAGFAALVVFQAALVAFYGRLVSLTPYFRACEANPSATCLGELAADALPVWYYWSEKRWDQPSLDLIYTGHARRVLERLPAKLGGTPDLDGVDDAITRFDLSKRAVTPNGTESVTCLAPADCLIAAITLTTGPETKSWEGAVWDAERAAFLRRAPPVPSPELARLLDPWSASIARAPAKTRRWHHSLRGEFLLSIGLRNLARDSFYLAAAAPAETISGRRVVNGLVELRDYKLALAVARMEPDPDYRARDLLQIATGLAPQSKPPLDIGSLLREIVETVGPKPRVSFADPLSVLAATAELASRLGDGNYARTIARILEAAAERRDEHDMLKAAQAWAWVGDMEAAHRLVAAAIVQREVIPNEAMTSVLSIGPVRDSKNDSSGAAKRTASTLLCRLGDTDASFEVASLSGDYAREAALDIFDCLTDRMGTYPDIAWVASRIGLKSEGQLIVRRAARQVIAGDYDAAAESILAALDSGDGSSRLSQWHHLRNLLKLAIAIRREDLVDKVQVAILSEGRSHSQSEFVKQLADAAAISAAWPN
jgi:hypothetical protein